MHILAIYELIHLKHKLCFTLSGIRDPLGISGGPPTSCAVDAPKHVEHAVRRRGKAEAVAWRGRRARRDERPPRYGGRAEAVEVVEQA